MSSQTSLIAKQCRIQSWAVMIKECQNRPEDMTIDEWCQQNNLTKANYYYRLKCVRQACLDSMESVPSFVELPVPETKSPAADITPSSVSAVIRITDTCSIEIKEHASPDFLRKLIGACTYAE